METGRHPLLKVGNGNGEEPMWTMDNTEGFTQDQLDLINEAYDLVAAKADDVDAKNIYDALNNAWIEQETAEELAVVALRLLGY